MYRVLLADDEGIMLESLKTVITSNFGKECELAFAKTGRAVVELAESFRPDIAFIDIQMLESTAFRLSGRSVNSIPP